MIYKKLAVGPFASNCYIVGSEKTGEGIVIEELVGREEAGPCLDPWRGFAGLNRVQMPCLPVKQRVDFVQVETGFTEQMAIEESNRCLQCQLRFQLRSIEVPPVR